MIALEETTVQQQNQWDILDQNHSLLYKDKDGAALELAGLNQSFKLCA